MNVSSMCNDDPNIGIGESGEQPAEFWLAKQVQFQPNDLGASADVCSLSTPFTKITAATAQNTSFDICKESVAVLGNKRERTSIDSLCEADDVSMQSSRQYALTKRNLVAITEGVSFSPYPVDHTASTAVDALLSLSHARPGLPRRHSDSLTQTTAKPAGTRPTPSTETSLPSSNSSASTMRSATTAQTSDSYFPPIDDYLSTSGLTQRATSNLSTSRAQMILGQARSSCNGISAFLRAESKPRSSASDHVMPVRGASTGNVLRSARDLLGLLEEYRTVTSFASPVVQSPTAIVPRVNASALSVTTPTGITGTHVVSPVAAQPYAFAMPQMTSSCASPFRGVFSQQQSTYNSGAQREGASVRSHSEMPPPTLLNSFASKPSSTLQITASPQYSAVASTSLNDRHRFTVAGHASAPSRLPAGGYFMSTMGPTNNVETLGTQQRHFNKSSPTAATFQFASNISSTTFKATPSSSNQSQLQSAATVIVTTSTSSEQETVRRSPNFNQNVPTASACLSSSVVYAVDDDSNDLSADGDSEAQRYRKRNRAAPPPPGRCHSCNISHTPEWRRGPDGARTLCNACGLHYAKMQKKLTQQRQQQQRRRASTGTVVATDHKTSARHSRDIIRDPGGSTSAPHAPFTASPLGAEHQSRPVYVTAPDEMEVEEDKAAEAE